MDASPRCIELIHGSEGFKTKLPDGRFKSYLDKLAKPNVWTIYCGLTKGVGADTVWTVEQCEKAFSKEMSFYEDAIERMVTVPLNQNQFDALVSLVYNIGPGSPTDDEQKGFYWSTMRKLINQGKFEEAAAQFKRYKHAGDEESEGSGAVSYARARCRAGRGRTAAHTAGGRQARASRLCRQSGGKQPDCKNGRRWASWGHLRMVAARL